MDISIIMGPWAQGPMGPMGPWAHASRGRDIFNSLPIREEVKAFLVHFLVPFLRFVVYCLLFSCCSCPGTDIFNSLPIWEEVKAFLVHLLGPFLCFVMYFCLFNCCSCPGRDMFSIKLF